MKFLLNNEKSLKSGLNLDFFFKIIFFYLYKLLIGNKFFYIIDKYLVEKFFFLSKSFFSYIGLLLYNLKFLNFSQIIKISIIIIIQFLIIFYI